ncbi:MAG: NHLP bacteriocin export ABC transporter permease/ATPase subunit [Selenomonadaceae bacterium]|nr:NHLP bacteriocin export ABC transporter permease/ATPase subunit [Selenomonadaceae bacterium]
MGNQIFLAAGDRRRLKDETRFLRIISGAAEVYAVTSDKSEFRQTFLMKLAVNDAAFPSMDEFGWLDTEIYATEDTTVEELSFAEVSETELKSIMTDWFSHLVDVPWIRLQTDRGDDILKTWQNRTVLKEVGEGGLIDAFCENQQIFAMLMGMFFRSEDKLLSKRQATRERQKQRLLDSSIANLLDESYLIYEESAETKRAQNMEDAAFVMRSAMQSLNLPNTNISIPADIAKKLDQVTLLRRLAAKANIALRFVSLEKDWHKKDCGVIIGYYGKKKTPAAFLPVTPKSYRMVTKDYPEGTPVTEEVAEKTDKDAFLCYAGFPAKKLKVMDLWRFMFRQCWKEDYRVIITISLFAGFIPLVTPIITETIFQDILPILDRKGLVTVTQVLMVTSFTMAALSVIRSIAMLRISTRINMTVEAALWSRLLTLPETFFKRFTVGELASRMQGMEAVKRVIGGNFVSAVFNTIFSFWSLILMCWYSIKLTAAAIAVWLLWCLAVAFIYRRVISLQRKLIKASNAQAGMVQQIFSGLSKFRIHGAEEQAYHLWSETFGETWRHNLALRWQGNYNSVIGAIQPFALTMLLYYIAVYGAQEPGTAGAIGYAQFLAFEAAYTSFNGALNSIIPLVGEFFKIQPHIENLTPILEELPEVTEDKMDADPLSGAIEVNNLTFSYGEGKEDVLKNISFRVTAGENLAIVGKSGCGKSTLVRLLLGFEQPKSGGIFYDGQSLSDLSLPSVRSQMGVVLQNGQLMTGDIFANIVGQSSLTQDDAWEAAEAAGIADDIRAMPMGMQTIISEGSSNISGGQRQRLMIARALAAKPAILIFDEATSALDNRAQAIVTESIDKLNVTRIVIAHRLSTIRNADRILVMDAGKIAESGTFDELMERDGMFAKLVKRQVA